MTPPRLARALIRAAAPADLAGALVDDLDETFARESARHGARAARLWYWREALGGLWMLVRIRLDRRRSRVPAVRVGRYSLAVALRHAARRLVAARGFSATAVLTLALAFAANLTIAALVYGVLLRPLPYPGADRIVDVGHRTPGLGVARAGQSQGAWFFYRRESRSFEAIGIYNENVVNLTDGGLEAERVPIAMISVEVLDALGVRPMFGGFTREDDGPTAPPTAMLSHDLWQRRYGGDPSIVGKTVEVNGNARRVIAVMPRGFAFPTAGTGLWMRQGFDPREARFGELVYGSVARLREGVRPEAAEAELNTLIRRLPDEYADVRPAWLTESQLSARVEPLKLVVTRDASSALWVTLAAGALVLLLGGANVTNLFLIRSEQRVREAGIARALGATSRHLFATLLAETLLVATAAAAIAVPIATFALNLVLARAQGLLPRLDAVAIDGVTLAGLTVIAVLTALVLAAAGLWRTRGVTLRDAGRSASASPAQARVRLALSSVQVALAFALVVTSTLLVRSVWNLIHLDKGFSADRVLTFEIALPFRGYDTFRKSAAYHATLLERLRALPGVEAAGAVTDLPLSGFTLKRYLDSLVFVERAGQAPIEVNGVNWKLATPGYFDAMRIPVLRGRWVQPGDHFDDTFPVVVSDGFARRHLGDSPLGQRIKHYADPHWWTVVGVVGDVRDDGLRMTPAEAAYAPVLDQEKGAPFTSGSMTHVVRTTVPPESIAAAVRGVVAGLDNRVPLDEMQTMATVVSRSMARDALVLALVAVAAALAVVMGLVGLYGALAYSIAQRRRELGVRLALGATAGRLRGEVSRAPGAAIVVGLAAGATLTWLSSRLLSGLLFGVEAGDAATYAASAVILISTCAIAVALSLRGLRRVSPLEALRSE